MITKPLIYATPRRQAKCCSDTEDCRIHTVSLICGGQNGVWVPGAFELDHLQLVELILSHNFFNFSIFMLGSPIPYYPRGWTREKGNHQKWMTNRGLSAWGIRTEPFAAGWADFVPQFFNFSIFMLGSPIPYYANGWTRGKGNHQKWMTQRGLSALGIRTGPFAAGWADFVPQFF